MKVVINQRKRQAGITSEPIGTSEIIAFVQEIISEAAIPSRGNTVKHPVYRAGFSDLNRA
jgi:hypothetical protein